MSSPLPNLSSPFPRRSPNRTSPNRNAGKPRERKADPSLAPALQQIRTAIEQKRVLVFGLRTLAQLSASTNRHFGDNVYESVDQEIVPVLCQVTERYKDDPDIAPHVAKIFAGFIRALDQDPQPGYQQKLQAAGFGQAAGTILAYLPMIAEPSNSPEWASGVQIADVGGMKLGVVDFKQAEHGKVFLANSVKALEKGSFSPAFVAGLTRSLELYLKQTGDYQGFLGEKLPTKILVMLNVLVSKASSVDTNLAVTIAEALHLVQLTLDQASQTGTRYSDEAALRAALSLMQATQTNKGQLQQQCSRLLSALVGPEEVDRTLKEIESGGQGALAAMSLLSALSLAPDFSSSFTKRGGVGPLCTLVSSCASSVNLKDQASLAGLRGACTMLTAVIAENPKLAEEKAAVDAAVPALLELLTRLDASRVDTAAAVCQTLTELVLASPKAMSRVLQSPPNLLELFNVNRASERNAQGCRAAMRLAAALTSTRQNLQFWTADGKYEESLARQFKAIGKAGVPPTVLDPNMVAYGANFLKNLYGPGGKDAAGTPSIWVPALVAGLNSLAADDDQAFGAVMELAAAVLRAEPTPDGPTRQAMVDADFSQAVLKAMLVFADKPELIKVCSGLLEQTASGADLERAVSALKKHSSAPAAKQQECLAALSTIHGLLSLPALASRISAAADGGSAAADAVLPTLIKALHNLLSATSGGGAGGAAAANESLRGLVSACLACIRAAAARQTGAQKFGMELAELLETALLPRARNMTAAETSGSAHRATPLAAEIVACTSSIVAQDRVESLEVLVKLQEAAGLVMRKYPEQRKTHVGCVELLTRIANSREHDATAQLVQLGVMKQVLTHMLKAAVIEEHQRAGLQLLLAVAQRRPAENPEALRRLGALEVLQAVSSNHQSKPDLLRLLAQCQKLLQPESEAKSQLGDQFALLETAAKNRDFEQAANLLGTIAQLTIAPDSARFAVREGLAGALETFVTATRQPPAVALSDAAATHLSAIFVNVAAIGRPHSSRIGGLALIAPAIADPRLSTDARAKLLEGARALLVFEKNLAAAPGAEETRAYLAERVPELLKNPAMTWELIAVATTLALINRESDLARPQYLDTLRAAVERLKNSCRTEAERCRCLESFYQIFAAATSNRLTGLFAEAGGVEACVRLLDTVGSSEPKTLYWCRKLLERVSTRAAADDSTALHASMLRSGGSGAVEYACKALGKNLAACKGDAEASATMLSTLCKFTKRLDRKVLEESNLLSVVAEASAELGEGAGGSLKLAMGEMLSRLGADEWLNKLFTELEKVCREQKPNWISSELPETSSKLLTFVPCALSNIELAFAAAPAAMKTAAGVLGKLKKEGKALAQLAAVSKAIAERFQSEPGNPFGAEMLLQSGFVSAACGLISENDASGEVRKTGEFIANFYWTLAAICKDDLAYPALQSMFADGHFLRHSWDVVYRWHTEPEQAAAITAFLGYFARDQKSAAMLNDSLKKAGRIRELGGDAGSVLFNTTWKNKRNGKCAEVGLDAASRVAGYLETSEFLDKQHIKDTSEKLKALAESSAEGAAGYGAFVENLIELAPELAAGLADAGNVLKVLVDHYLKLLEEDGSAAATTEITSVEDFIGVRERLVGRIASLTALFAKTADNTDAIREAAVVAGMVSALRLEETSARGALAGAACSVAASVSRLRPLQQSVLVKLLPALFVETLPQLRLDLRAASHCMETVLYYLESDDSTLSFFQNLVETLDPALCAAETLALDAAVAEAESGEKARLGATCCKIREFLKMQSDDDLTLEKVHKRWVMALEAAEDDHAAVFDLTQVSDSRFVKDVAFVVSKMRELAKEPISSVEGSVQEAGREFVYGNKCLGLLGSLPGNAALICAEEAATTGGETKQYSVQKFLVPALQTQQQEAALQAVVNGTLLLVQHASAAWALEEGAARVAVNLVERARNVNVFSSHLPKTIPESERAAKIDEYMTKRLQWMEYLCGHDRQLYNGLDPLKVLAAIWDDVEADATPFTDDACLKQLIRTMRAISNEQLASRFIELQLPKRLLAIVQDPEAPNDLLADVLFCLGHLAGLPGVRNHIGKELGGVEALVELLRRCSLLPSGTKGLARVEQNTCLALGNLVLGHAHNANAFGNAKGIDLVIKIMNQSMKNTIDYDVANAASLLMCNVSFKRDDFKEALVARGADSAILLSIKRYDGAESAPAHRCLNSMFKAIANLCILPSNVVKFLANDISGSLKAFYKQGDSLPDDLILNSLRTLANLTAENTDTFMVEFGALIPSLLSLLKDTSRPHTDPTMLAFLFEVFASLCRNEDNRDRFVSMGGIELVIATVNQVKDEGVYTQALSLFAVLAPYTAAARRMVEGRLFNLILSLLDEVDSLSSDSVAAGIRVIRRLVADSAAGEAFIGEQPMALLCDCLCAAAAQANVDIPSMTAVHEIDRILLTLLKLNPAPHGAAVNRSAPVEVAVPATARRSELSNRRSKSFSRVFSRGGFSLQGIKKLGDKVAARALRAEDDETEEDESDDDSSNESDAASSDEEGSAFRSASADGRSTRSHSEGEGGDEEGDDDAATPKKSSGARGGRAKVSGRGAKASSASDEEADELELSSPAPARGDAGEGAIYKPLEPRGYQLIGMDDYMLVRVCRALFEILCGQEGPSLSCNKFTAYALSLLCYGAAEKPDGIGSVFEDSQGASDMATFITLLCDGIKETKSIYKLDQLERGAVLLPNALAVCSPALLQTIAHSHAAMHSIKAAANQLRKKKDLETRRRLQEVYALLNFPIAELRPSLFYHLVTYLYPLDSEDYSVEEYPNGVQDLPARTRTKIRKGGKCLLLRARSDNSGAADLISATWKSAPDMSALRIVVAAKHSSTGSEETISVPLARARKVERGLYSTPLLKDNASKLRMKGTRTITLVANPSPESPNGAEVTFMLPTRLRASRLMTRLQTWQCAAHR